MPRHVDKIILRNTARGLVPASALDAELLAGLPLNANVEAKRLRVGRRKAHAAWWLLCSRVADCMDEQHTSRSISNAILLDLDMVEAVAAVGGEHRIPMSIADFEDEQLWKLVEAAKRHVVTTLLPGINIEVLLKVERDR